MNTQVQTVAVPVLSEQSNAMQTPAFSLYREAERISFARPYDPKIVAIAGKRHAILRYRNTDGKQTKIAQMVTVPQIVLSDDLRTVMSEKEQAVFLGTIEDAQDLLIKSLVDDKKASNIGWDVVGYSAVLDFLTAERVSQRLTKEQIEGWFAIAGKEFCDTRAAQICEAKGITDAVEVAKQKAGTLNAYKERFCKLAAPVPNLGENEANALSNMLVVSKLDDDMAKVLSKKLYAILHPVVTENTDL